MSNHSTNSGVVMNTLGDVLVVTLSGTSASRMGEVQKLLRDEVLQVVRSEVISVLVLDFSALEILDRTEFQSVLDLAKMAKILGVNSYFVGISPGVASSLVLFDLDIGSVRSALNLEAALEHVNSLAASVSNEDKSVTYDEAEIHDYNTYVHSMAMISLVATKLNCSNNQLLRIRTVASELANNILKFAESGRIGIRVVTDKKKLGIEIRATDKGPGIPDVKLAMTDEYSTSGTLGLGLGGTQRMVDEFSIESVLGEGTTVTGIVWL